MQELLDQSAKLHKHLCPRQVLGVRMGLFAGRLLDLDVPQPRHSKRLITFVEIDGCFSDGVAVATNCWVGGRTLRVVDLGKVAATFADRKSERAVRIRPRKRARALAQQYAPEAKNRWEAYLYGYQRIPLQDLFTAQPVDLLQSLESIISRPTFKVTCELCSEEIFNQRERICDGRILCRACLGEGYYRALTPESSSPSMSLREESREKD